MAKKKLSKKAVKEFYTEAIKNPLWQKKRLQILSRDNFTCQICGHDDKTLHVHHLYYESGMNPWEYPEDAMITLCEDCHKSEHESKKNILKVIDQLNHSGFTMIEIESMLEYASYMFYHKHDVLDLIGNIDGDDCEQDYWGLDFPDCICKRLSKWRKAIYGRMDKDK